MVSKILALGAVTSVFIPTVSGFWRMICKGEIAQARMDPLMSPDEDSAHMHTIFGSSGFSESATFADLRDGNCTSCAVTQDHSVYWAPSLFFKHADGTFEPVSNVGGMLAYYLLRDPLNDVKGFPEDFRMIAGSNYRRNYTVGDPNEPDPDQSSWAALNQTTQDDLAQRALGFNCLNYDKDPEASLYRHYMPDKAYLDENCIDGIRFELAFPSCWNGKDVDSTNHKSHMAYPDLVQNGDCPEDFPVRLITLFYETIWDTYEFNGQDGEFVVANGDLTGYGYHGDFMMGWDGDFLQQAVDTCTNLSGLIEDCDLFNIISEAEQTSCKIDLPSNLAMENVLGSKDLLTALPGNVQIQAGPAEATAGTVDSGSSDPETSSLYVAPSLSYSKGPSSSPGAIMLQSVSGEASEYVAEAAATTSSSMGPMTTPASTTTAASNVDYEAVTTQTITNGAQVQVIVWKEAVVYVIEDVVTTVTVTSLPTNMLKSEHKKERRDDHVWRHRHHGRR